MIPNMSERDRPQTIVEWTTATLREEILSGQAPQNQPLRQEEIAARLGISRMPIREALRRLAAEGLILERPNRKAIVAPLIPADAVELFQIRAELECLAVTLSFPRLSDAECAAITAAHEALRSAEEGTYMDRHLAFHQALYAGAGPRLRGLITQHIQQAERYLRYERARLPVTEEDRQEHEALAAAARARDPAAAVAVLRPHIAEAGEDIAAALIRAEEDTP